MTALVYYFYHDDFPGVEFFAARRYIHVMEEVPEESLFGPTEFLACQMAVMKPIYVVDEDK